MSWRYEYTPYVWPMLGSAIFLSALSSYGWRCRSVPGALPFAFLAFFVTLFAIGAGLELLAVDLPEKIFWFDFQAIWLMPAATASLWFALDYADLSRWLTRWVFPCLWIAPVLVLLVVVTNPHWLLAGFRLEGEIRTVLTPAARVAIGHGFLLALANSGVFLRDRLRPVLHVRKYSVRPCTFSVPQVSRGAVYKPVRLALNPYETCARWLCTAIP